MIMAFFLFACDKSDTGVENSDDFSGNSGTFIDNRDGREYNWVKIDGLIWMAENLAFDTGEDCWIYEEIEGNLDKFGRLYSISSALSAVPDGWHLATNSEWEFLANYVNDIKGPFEHSEVKWEEIGRFLKSKSDWSDNANGNDEFGINLQPGGWFDSDELIWEYSGASGNWWTATITGDRYIVKEVRWAHSLFRTYNVDPTGNAYSVRCIKN